MGVLGDHKAYPKSAATIHNVRFHFKLSGLKKLVKLNGYEIGKITINFNENTIF